MPIPRMLIPAALAALALLLGGTPVHPQPFGFELDLELAANGLGRPLAITHAGDGSGRLFIAEQGGTIRVLQGGGLLAEPFLDLGGRVSNGAEQGLLGLAFHPAYASNGRFFVHYSDPAGDTVLARFNVSATNPNRAAPNPEAILLQVSQPFSNHNGGQLAFGPDGYLYIALGDGGSGGDPQNNAQNLSNLLGKILRLDVDNPDPGLAYGIPADNPFLGNPGARDEVWVYGLRNPWRFSFDRVTGDLFIGDVGQGAREEIDFQSATSPGGENFGWRRMEGNRCFNPPRNCNDGSIALPILEYTHEVGVSVTGGFRYRGSREPQLRGVYIFGDFGSGTFWGATPRRGVWNQAELLRSGIQISTFGEDEAGELYVADYSGGDIFRLTLAAGPCRLDPGHPNFCRDCGPCAPGQGDCDGDAQCTAGARCSLNVGGAFGFDPSVDVCTSAGGDPPPTSGCDLPLGHSQFCLQCGPCGQGEGDCDGSVQCAPGLRCAANVGADFGFRPNIDVCVGDGSPPPTCDLPPGHSRFCIECGPCRQGEGDCDGSAQCAPGFRCASNVGADFGFPPNVDVCVR